MDKVLRGVVGIRNKDDRYKIDKTIPMYMEVSPEELKQIQEQEEKACGELAKVVVEAFKQYKDVNEG